MAKWEYKVLRLDYTHENNLSFGLNAWGNDGWELVSMMPESAQPTSCILVFKRQV